MNMKKNRNIIIAVIVLGVAAIALILTNSRSTFKRALSDFAVDDTSTITRIFMSDKNNNTLTLARIDSNKWLVNNKYPGHKYNIDMLLGTILHLEVREMVPKTARNNIIRELAANSVKVEIYQRVYRIDLFGRIRLFPHEKLTKVFYVGGATQSNRGTYMIMEHSSQPFVTYLPGFRGFVTPRFMPIEKYWRDYSIFRKNIYEIASVRVEFPSNPEWSFMVKNNPDMKVELISLADHKTATDFDTLKVMNFLSSFRNINFEALLNDMEKHRKDSILASVPFHIITVTDTSGASKTIKTFRRQAKEGDTDINGNPLPYDYDRMYALVNDGQDFTLVQFFVFDRIIRPKMFYLGQQVRPGK